MLTESEGLEDTVADELIFFKDTTSLGEPSMLSLPWLTEQAPGVKTLIGFILTFLVAVDFFRFFLGSNISSESESLAVEEPRSLAMEE